MKARFTFILTLAVCSVLAAGCSKNGLFGGSPDGKAPPEKYNMEWSEAENLTQIVADHAKTLPEIKGILAVSRGGLTPASVLGNKLGIRNIRVICLASYGETKEFENLKVIYGPNDIAEGGKGWLIVDDLVDKGGTFKYLHTLYPAAHYVTLAAKPAGKAFTNFSAKDFAQDIWIVFPWEKE
ncbi:MAG: xanthine phosphoribosyltransferase [Alphaproteobacteria bacterium]|nr:xanthine phosphoribosyltransferase [Alphaproteobacteria bacterium]